MSKQSVNQLMQRAALHQKKGEFAEARSLYKTVLEMFPNNKKAQSALANADLPKVKQAANAANPTRQQIAQLNALYSQGRFADVATAAKQLAQQFPASFVVWSFLGAGAAQSAQNALALEAYKRAAKLRPQDAETHYSTGVILQELDKQDAAIASYQRALSIKPDHADALNNLGNAYKEKDMLDDAIKVYRRTLELRPQYVGTICNMGNALKDQDKLEEAIACYHKALQIKPDHADAYCNLGNAHSKEGELTKAFNALKAALKIDPNHNEALVSMGNVLEELGHFEKGEAAYRAAIQRDPNKIEAYIGLSRLLQHSNKVDEALKVANEAVRVDPKSGEAYTQLGSCLSDKSEDQEAKVALQKALELSPELPRALLVIGNIAMEHGEKDKAKDYFERAVAAKPKDVGGYLALVRLSKVKEGDAAFAQLQQAVQDTKTIHPETQISLHYGLGKGYEDLKQFEPAWDHYAKGAALKRTKLDYDPDHFDSLIDTIIAMMTPERIAQLREAAIDDSSAIFVLGMPRSGTTLTETILASHPDVFGAGELSYLHRLMPAHLRKESFHYPTVLTDMPTEKLSAIAQKYVAALRKHAPDTPKITDKMPANFLYVGLIHALMPNARIIHTIRDPMDCCVSNFTRLFKRTQPHSYDQVDMARYHNGYRRLMAHWRAVLPKDAFLDFEYEGLIADFEPQARRLVDWAGLPWDDACLEFHRTKRSVRTASVTQVRQPIYKSSVKKWEHYKAHLGPMMETLGVT